MSAVLSYGGRGQGACPLRIRRVRKIVQGNVLAPWSLALLGILCARLRPYLDPTLVRHCGIQIKIVTSSTALYPSSRVPFRFRLRIRVDRRGTLPNRPGRRPHQRERSAQLPTPNRLAGRDRLPAQSLPGRALSGGVEEDLEESGARGAQSKALPTPTEVDGRGSGAGVAS